MLHVVEQGAVDVVAILERLGLSVTLETPMEVCAQLLAANGLLVLDEGRVSLTEAGRALLAAV